MPDENKSPSPARANLTGNMKRQIDHAPRIFLSYRRADSIAVTGRLYDRLVSIYGEDFIFKDMEDIPAGANFAKVIDEQVALCDVQLVIMGRDWAGLRPDGTRRIDDEEDFVRIEVESGLSLNNVLVIPVLINGADMPAPENLPASIQQMSYLNAAVLRNDPDFNRDLEWLITQINNSFDITTQKRSARALPGIVAALVLVAIIAVGIALAASSGNTSPLPDETPAAQTDTIVQVDPVPDGFQMVLVAEPENLGNEERAIQRLIVRDLEQHFGIGISQTAVRSYPAVITSDETARAVAIENGAGVIIWGDYDSEIITMNVQLGALSAFGTSKFTEDDVRAYTDVRYELANANDETLAFGVIAVQNMAYTAVDNIFEVSRNLVISTFIDRSAASLSGRDLASFIHRMIANYVSDPQAALNFIAEAKRQAPDAPILYASSAITHLRIGNYADVQADTRTASEFGPDNWASPETLLAMMELFVNDDLQGALPHLNTALALNPDDWLMRGLRALVHYLLGNYAEGLTDATRALELNPQSDFVYGAALTLNLRARNYAATQQIYAEGRSVVNPTLTEDILLVAVNEEAADTPIIIMNQFFSNILLSQWSRAVENAEQLEGVIDTAEVYFGRGVAECTLGDYAAAEASYTAALERDPSFALAHVLRAEVRNAQNDLVGVAEDTRAIAQSAEAALFVPILNDFISGEFDLSCETLFTADLTPYLDTLPQTTSEASDD